MPISMACMKKNMIESLRALSNFKVFVESIKTLHKIS